jgi:hypothetical protein
LIFKLVDAERGEEFGDQMVGFIAIAPDMNGKQGSSYSKNEKSIGNGSSNL